MKRAFASISFVTLASPGFSQPPPTKPAFDIADVRVSPRGNWVKKAANNIKGGFLTGDRYELGRATMLDLIKTAYSIDAEKIYGGPSWLDYDRFDVTAKAPAATRPEVLKSMLQSLLEDRFNLVVKMDTRPMPAYVLSAAKGKPKMKAADGSGPGTCQNIRGPEFATTNVQCRGVTMEAFAAELRRRADVASRNIPVVDSTGLEGIWDFDLQYGAAVTNMSTGITTQTGGTLTEAVEKQLGLTLELSKTPQQVLVVENVKQQPSANPPGVAAALPPRPDPEFEVASIRPCDGTVPTIAPRAETGGRVTMTCFPLLTMIDRAFGVDPTSQQVVGLPKWAESNSTKDNFSLNAKAPAGAIPDGVNGQTREILNAMLRTLLIDRYKLAFHYEDRQMDAYSLVAAKPKLTKADPSRRTGCTRLNGAGVTPGLACQNIAMAQFAEQIQAYDTTFLYPVLDATGLDGAWDFTVNYNPLSNAAGIFAALSARNGIAPAEPSDPSGAVTFADALEKQLGLKLEKHKRPEPVLVIDHLEEKPTEN